MQIVTMNATTGKLKLVNGAFWSSLEDFANEKVRLILTFGAGSTGKSVLASMLGCAMHEDSRRADMFPTFLKRVTNFNGRTMTEGIWASSPISLPGVEGKYIILDMMSEGEIGAFQGKLQASRKEDNIHKMLALMSEVASTFVFTMSVDEPRKSHWDLLGLAMAETRENMVIRANGKNVSAPSNQQLNLKSHNSPSLILAHRLGAGGVGYSGVCNTNDFSVNQQELHDRAAAAKTDLTKDEASGKPIFEMIERNFQAMKNGNHEGIPYVYNPLPTIAQGTNDKSRFDWLGKAAYDYSAGQHCQIFDRMNSSRWRCKSSSRPGAPAQYRLMIENMVETLKAQAPVRLVSWRGQDNPTALTADKIKVVLEQGIAEMNSIGPLPRSELWRKIMQDRCLGEIVQYLDFEYGESSGKYSDTTKTGILKTISDGLVELGLGTIPDPVDMEARWKELDKKWTSKTPFDTGINGWFSEHPLLEAVMDTCKEDGGEPHIVLLNEMHETLEAEWTAILANRQRQIAEEALRQALETNWWQNFWDEWKLYIVAGAILMVPVMLIFCRIWGMVAGTCRTCASCCGDWGDTTTTTKIITVQQGGGSSSHNAPLEKGPAVPFASALAVPAGGAPSSSGGDPYARIENINNTIKQLQKRASK